MKKLTKLNLKEFHEMSNHEMKNILGGYGDYDGDGDGNYGGNTDPSVGKCSRDRCNGEKCVVADSAEPHPNLHYGKCGWTLYPSTRCTCAAGYLG